MNSLRVDSAGISSWHIREKPDRRALSAGLARGLDISGHRSRLIGPNDFIVSDIILALDEEVYGSLVGMTDCQCVNKIRLLMDFAERTTEREVPTPYFGDEADFELMLDLIQDGVCGLAAYLKSLRA